MSGMLARTRRPTEAGVHGARNSRTHAGTALRSNVRRLSGRSREAFLQPTSASAAFEEDSSASDREGTPSSSMRHPEVSLHAHMNTDGWSDGSTPLYWASLEQFMHLECVSVLLFGAGTGQTGVYSLQQWTEEEDGADGGLPHDTVLAFESPSDAEQYAKLLERQMGRRAQVEPINPRDLQGFCAQAGFDSRVVDRSAVTLGLFQPPQQTVDVTDWERASALRAGRYSVLADHPEGGGAAEERWAVEMHEELGLSGPLTLEPLGDDQPHAPATASELERRALLEFARARLEGLYRQE